LVHPAEERDYAEHRFNPGKLVWRGVVCAGCVALCASV